MEDNANVRVEQLPDGRYRATAEEFPGVVAKGENADEAIKLARDVIRQRREQSNPFAKYAGCLGGFQSRSEMNEWLRDLRGHDEV
jgi:hypothetical protein